MFKYRKRYFLTTTFTIAFLISSLALTGILSNNVSQDTERDSARMIHTASASSEDGGDGDQGGDSGGDGDQGGDSGGDGDQDDTSEDSGNDQGGDKGECRFSI